MNTSDSALLERWITRRDPEAMALIVSRYSGMVYATCKRVTRNAADAEDIAQECFLKLSSVSRGGTSLAGLLHTMATRLSLNKARGDARRRAREAEYTALHGGATEATWDDIQPLIDEAIAALPEGQSTVLIRHFLRGETHGEIADDLGLTRAAISKRVAKGVEEVREALRGRGVIASVASLGAMLAAAGAEAAPMALTESLGRLAVSGAGRTGTHWAAGGGLAWGKALVACLIVAGIGVFAWRTKDATTGTNGEQRAAATATNRDLAGGPVAEVPSTPAPVRADSAQAKATAVLGELPRGEGVLTAYVTDRTGLPAAGVAVTLMREDSTRVLAESVSDGRGKLVFEELAWGKYLLRAVQGKAAARATVSLSAEWPSARGELVLKPGGDIRGTVAVADGAPVPGAAVQLMDAEGDREAPAMAETDETGAFVLEAITLGQYRVRVVAAGYAPALTEEVRIDSAPLAITLSRGGTLEGQVRFAASGLPAPGVALKLSSPAFEGLERGVATDEHGRFRSDTLPAGPCYIVSTDDRYAFNPVRADVVLADDRVERAELILEDGAQVSGTITDGATGEPIAGVVVFATDQPSRMHYWKSAPTGPGGRYQISGLSAGDCEVSATSFPPRYSDGGYDSRQPVSLQPGEARDGIDFQFVSGAVVEGEVVDEEGYPVPRATVVLELSSLDGATRNPWPTVTDAFGKFCFADAGRAFSSMNEEVGVENNIDGATFVVRAAFRDARSKDMGPLPLPAEGISGIRLQLNPEPVGAIAGFAVDESGQPANARIFFDRLEGAGRFSARGASTDVDGFFLSNNLEAGTYGLQISPREDHVMTVFLAEGQRVTDLRVVVESGGNITGRVTDAEGRPVKSVSVSASDAVVRYNDVGVAYTTESQSTYTNGDGKFSLDNLEEGEYLVSTGYEALNGGHWQGMASTGDDLEIVLPPPSDQGTDPDPR